MLESACNHSTEKVDARRIVSSTTAWARRPFLKMVQNRTPKPQKTVPWLRMGLLSGPCELYEPHIDFK
jgi:hypothetical protein